MRKLFAMVATVAVVLSMFAGIAFAAPAGTDPASVTFTKGWIVAATAAQHVIGIAKEADGDLALSQNIMIAKVNSDGTKGADLLAAAVTTDVATGAFDATLNAQVTTSDAVGVWFNNGDAWVKIADVAIYKLLLNTSAIMSSDTLSLQPVTGSLVNARTGALFPETFIATVAGKDANGNNFTDSRETSNGSFTLYVPTNAKAQSLAVKAERKSDTALIAATTLPIKYTVTLSSPLEYNFDADKLPTAIMGTVTNSAGKAVKQANVYLTLDGVTIMGNADPLHVDAVKTDDNGNFGKVVTFNNSGELKLFVEGVEHLKGKVAAIGMNLTVTPNTGIAHSVADTKMTFVISNGPANGTVSIKAYDSDDKEVKDFTTTTLDATGYKKWEDRLWKPTAAGTYTIKAVVTGTHSASATVTVVNPASYNMVNESKLTEMSIGETTLKFDNLDIYVKRYNAGGVDGTTFKYVVTVDGKVKIDQRATAAAELQITDLKLTADALGTKTIRVQAYEGATNVFDKTYTMKVTGLDVQMDTKELAVGETKDITIVIKDENGVPVNNAVIKLDGTDKVDSSKVNIQNGTYVMKAMRYTAPAVVKVQVYVGGAKKVEMNLTVLGQKVYNVASETSAILLGKANKVRLTVNENGTAFVPAKLMVQVGDAAATAQAFTAVDVNKDGIYDAIDVTITPTSTKNIVLRAENYNGTKCGEYTLTVKAAKLEVISNGKVTENIKTKVSFRIVNPIDNSVIKENVTLVKNAYVTNMNISDINGGVSGATLVGAEQYEVNLLVDTVDYDAATKAEKVPQVDVQVYGYNVDAAFPVAKATITSNPAEIIIGQANNLTLTYADANGNAIAKKEIKNDVGTLLGKTDDKGQIVYATTGALILKAQTDVAGKTTDVTLNAVVDIKAPVVTAPETTDKGTATITVTDNVRVARLMVNGVELNIIPRAELSHVVNLKVGVNTFNVIAVDNNFNVVEQTVTITYTPAANNSTVLKGDAVQRKGEYVLVQIRQFEELGAKLTWNDAAKTATFVAGGKTVEVTVGSTTAKVNGVAATMPTAPINVNGRVMVPTRFIAEALGWNVQWAAGDIVTITLP